MAGTIKSSKPTLSGIDSTSPSKSVLHVNRDGVLVERGGTIYMTQPVVTDITTEDDRGACCEGETLITAVGKVTEDIFLPVVCTDSYGNLQKVVRSSTGEDVYGGQPLKRNRE